MLESNIIHKTAMKYTCTDLIASWI